MTSLTRRTLLSTLGTALVLAVCSTASPTSAAAQSAQRYALQGSVLGTSIKSGGGTIGGVGIEAQFRLNRLVQRDRGTLSAGFGTQYTAHQSGGDDLNIAGIFVEPRWVPNVASEKLVPYLAARASVLRQSNNFGTSSYGGAIGGGGGFAIVLSRTVNIDVGLSLLYQRFGDFYFNDLCGGIVAGTGSCEPGTFKPFITYAAKAGLSVGFPSGKR